MKTEPGLGVVQPQAKEHQGPSGTERNREEPLEGVWPCQHLDSGLLASRTMRGYVSVALDHPVGVILDTSNPKK